jgi:transposase
MAKNGILPARGYMWGPGGAAQLDALELPMAYTLRLESLRDLLVYYDREIAMLNRRIHRELEHDAGYNAIRQIPGVGRVIGAIFCAEIGDISRFPSPERLCSWAGLTPKHHESDTHVHRGRITKQGSRLVRWAAVESVKRIGAHTVVGACKHQVAERRGKNVGTVAAARKQIEFVYYALRDHHVRALYPPGSPRRRSAGSPGRGAAA